MVKTTRLDLAFLFTVACTMPSTLLLAQNPEFVPGDAFFYSEITHEFVGKLAGNKITFTHVDSVENFGSFYGFNRLRINNVPDKAISDLQLLYSDLREFNSRELLELKKRDGSIEIREMNPFPLLIYNADVDWEKQRIGMRLNENWKDVPPEALSKDTQRYKSWNLFGKNTAPTHRVYHSFVQNYEAVKWDIRFAEWHDPLKVTVPKDIAWAIHGPRITTPVECEFEDVQLIVLTSNNLNKYFRRNRYYRFYSIDKDGISVHAWRNGQHVSISYERYKNSTSFIGDPFKQKLKEQNSEKDKSK